MLQCFRQFNTVQEERLLRARADDRVTHSTGAEAPLHPANAHVSAVASRLACNNSGEGLRLLRPR